MATTEHTINDALAAVLRETRRAWSAAGVVTCRIRPATPTSPEEEYFEQILETLHFLP